MVRVNTAMREMIRASLVLSAFAFLASVVGLCPCDVQSGSCQTCSDVEESSHGPDGNQDSCGGGHATPQPSQDSNDKGCGDCPGDGPASGGTCCCSTSEDQPIVQSVIQWTPVTRISDLLPTARVESGLADDQNNRRIPHPPPNEGFKAWPDVPLFILHSAYLI